MAMLHQNATVEQAEQILAATAPGA